jgi:hypothetical protein
MKPHESRRLCCDHSVVGPGPDNNSAVACGQAPITATSPHVMTMTLVAFIKPSAEAALEYAQFIPSISSSSPSYIPAKTFNPYFTMSDEGKLIPPDHNPAEEAFEFGAAESLQAYDLTDGMYEYPHMPTMFQHVTEEVCLPIPVFL